MRNMIITKTCPFCGEFYEVAVNDKAYDRWMNGELIQCAMPDLTPPERGQLITGLCRKCLDKTFGAEDDC